MIKWAKTELTTKLLPHQRRVVEKLSKRPGLVVAHGLGSGKTLASIAAAARMEGDNLALVPAALQSNYKKEIEQHTQGDVPVEVGSAQRAALRMESGPSNLLILDEAHRGRETKTKLHQLIREYPAEKKMLLTASPVYNKPSDIAALVNMAASGDLLPEGAAFDKRYVKIPDQGVLSARIFGVKKPELANTKELKEVLDDWVDYHPASGKDFPARMDSIVPVSMSRYQSKVHDAALGKLSPEARRRLRAGLPIDKKEIAKLNQFQSQTRQVGGSMGKFTTRAAKTSPKVLRAVSDLNRQVGQNPQHRAVVYSNYLDTLDDYGTELDKKHIPYATFTGKMKKKEREQAVNDFNQGKLKALLVSSAGGEGLDLKGTRQVQVLEPHWNEEKLKQVIGRAIRRGSHSHLPKGQRNVMVQRYLAHPKPSIFERMSKKTPEGIEHYLYNKSKEKEDLNQQLVRLLEKK